MLNLIKCFLALFIMVAYSVPPAIATNTYSDAANSTASVVTARKTDLKTTSTGHHWLTKKKVIIAVIVGCLIATAIVVPIAVSAHNHHEDQQAFKKALTALVIQNNQDAAHIQRLNTLISSDLQQESVIKQQLAQSNLTDSQAARLQSNLTKLQGEILTAQRSEAVIANSQNFSLDVRQNLSQSFEASDFPAVMAAQDHHFTVSPVATPAVIARYRDSQPLNRHHFRNLHAPAILAAENTYNEMWTADADAMAGYQSP